MLYKSKSSAALHIALGGLPDKMAVEVDAGIEVSARTVGELRKVTAWPEKFGNYDAAGPLSRVPRTGPQRRRLAEIAN